MTNKGKLGYSSQTLKMMNLDLNLYKQQPLQTRATRVNGPEVTHSTNLPQAEGESAVQNYSIFNVPFKGKFLSFFLIKRELTFLSGISHDES